MPLLLACDVRWLAAGATASDGTVGEPGGYTTKFPGHADLLHHCFRGETIIEAYWKSVAMAGEGWFIGETRASPWDEDEVDRDVATATLTLTTCGLAPGVACEVTAADEGGPFELIQEVTTSRDEKTVIRRENARRKVYRAGERT